ncbi:MAG: hypothetical protein IKX18_02115 [Muribaculaceae bacterium]|nr:hypothetical protein [Muribaculaceae bacterium]
MKRFNLTIALSLMAALMFAQEVTDAEIAAIRATYNDAKEQIELNNHAEEQGMHRSDMEVVSHYIIPGCGPTEEVIRYYFTLDEDPETGECFYTPYFISRSYNVAARKFYQEFLFDNHNLQLLFFFQHNDGIGSGPDEMRYYYGENGIHKSINGNQETDEIFAARTADDLKNAFFTLMNKEY